MPKHHQTIVPFFSKEASAVTKRRHRRPITEARREQNRASQARYRSNQKRIAEDSVTGQGATPVNGSSRPREQSGLTDPFMPSPLTTDESTSIEPQLTAWNTDFVTPNPLDSLNLLTLENAEIGTSPSQICEDHSWVNESNSTVMPVDSIRIPDVQPEPQSWPENISGSNLLDTSFQLEIRRIAPSSSAPTSQNTLPPGTFLMTNHIRLHDMTFIAATLAIAESIGVTADDYLNDRLSPFYLLSQATNTQSAAGYFEGKLKPHLRPSFTQLSRAHASYLDVIIFPQFRERAVVLATQDHRILDEAELMNDMLKGGLTCWGNAERGNGGRGCGVPWDLRSWEAKPWFLKKWWFLLEKEGDEMIETSRWWWAMRGEYANEAALLGS